MILQLGSSRIQAPADLPRALLGFHVGDHTAAVVRRNGAELSLPLQFIAADGPAPATAPPSAQAAQPSRAQVTNAAISCLLPPYTILPLSSTARELVNGLHGDTSVSVNGDVLSIVHRSTGSDMRIFGSLQLPMGHVAGTDLWLLQLKMSGWNRAFFGYSFYSGSAILAGVGSAGRFRGPDAPGFPEVEEKLHGQILQTTLHSTYLHEDRAVTVYLPPRATTGPLPVLFMMDGQACEEYARVLEPLMLAGKTRWFAIVGVHSAPSVEPGQTGYSPQTDQRSQEYVPGLHPDVFERHMRFFTTELLPWAARTYRVSDRPADRAIFGFSDGADFVLANTARHPELFGAALPFSPGMQMKEAPHAQRLPHVFLAAGELEPLIAAVTKQAYRQLLKSGADTVFTPYVWGHDPLMWQVALIHYMPHVFPPARK